MNLDESVIRWLHISDLHFQSSELWERRIILSALIRDVVEKCRNSGQSPDMVMVTGDIANSGKREEYDCAELFLRKLADTLDLDPRQRFFLVPGNHDVNRQVVGPGDSGIIRGLDSQASIEQIFRHPTTMRLLGERLANFYAFSERLLGPARAWHPERPFRVDIADINGVTLGIIQLNSTWAGGLDSDRENRLLVGAFQVHEALAESESAFLKIAMLHHPLSELQDMDRQVTDILRAPQGIDFLLSGHLHHNRATIQHTPDTRITELAAGATYISGTHPKSCQLVEINFTQGNMRVHLFSFSPEGRGFWKPDSGAYEHAADAIITWELPHHLTIGTVLSDQTKKPIPVIRQTSNARRQSLVARYREVAAVVFGSVRFIGLPNRRVKDNVRIPDLFTPLRFSENSQAGQDANIYDWSVVKLCKHLLGDVSIAGVPKRVVVLGPPGSGKTTLCRFLTVLCAGETHLPELTISDEVLPLFFPCREYSRQKRDQVSLSLIEFLYAHAKTQLSLSLPPDFLEGAFEAGQAVLLVDGVDELGQESDRLEMRDRLQGFCHLYPRVPVLVTSRASGYLDAPFSRFGTEAFLHLETTPFDDADLMDFINRWYTLQEPTDALMRERSSAELLAALEADPRVKELARTPLLATLIALIHRFEAQLPGERAKLLDLCVKTFLETWPAASGRRFDPIDPGLQRVYLEQLAYQMQKRRARDRNESNRDQGILIQRKDLINTLVAILRERHYKSEDREQTTRRVEDWLNFLQDGTGLLVEQAPSAFGFLHLSLMEYLAARGLERIEGRNFTKTLASHINKSIWEEVSLLAVGSHAEDGPFLDELLAALEERPSRKRWYFLLACMREEAAFTPDQTRQVLINLALWQISQPQDQRDNTSKLLTQVLKFSQRNKHQVQLWLNHRYANAVSKELQSTVLLGLPTGEEDFIAKLMTRTDRETVSCWLLDFWPQWKFARWASQVVAAKDALTWALSTPDEMVLLRLLANIRLGNSNSLAGALSLAVIAYTQRCGSISQAPIDRLVDEEKPGAEALPFRIRVYPGGVVIPCQLVWPTEFNLVMIQPYQWLDHPYKHEIAQNYAATIAHDFATSFIKGKVNASSKNFTTPSARKFARDYSLSFISSFASDLAREFAVSGSRSLPQFLSQQYLYEFARDFIRYFVRSFPDSFTAAFISDFPIVFNLDNGDKISTNVSNIGQHLHADGATVPLEASVSLDQEAWKDLRCAIDSKAARKCMVTILATLGAEIIIGLATTTKCSIDERTRYLRYRLENRWVLHLWSAIEQRLPEDPGADLLALYLSMGIAQYSSTWQWPTTERWSETFSKKPPTHWLPRMYYFVALSIQSPSDPVFREAITAAIAEGFNDSCRPGYGELASRLFFATSTR